MFEFLAVVVVGYLAGFFHGKHFATAKQIVAAAALVATCAVLFVACGDNPTAPTSVTIVRRDSLKPAPRCVPTEGHPC